MKTLDQTSFVIQDSQSYFLKWLQTKSSEQEAFIVSVLEDKSLKSRCGQGYTHSEGTRNKDLEIWSWDTSAQSVTESH